MIKEDIKQITNEKELQRLYIELNDEVEKQEKEIERLNNIIDELEKFINDFPEDYINYHTLLEKIKELNVK